MIFSDDFFLISLSLGDATDCAKQFVVSTVDSSKKVRRGFVREARYWRSDSSIAASRFRSVA